MPMALGTSEVGPLSTAGIPNQGRYIRRLMAEGTLTQ